MWRHVKHFFYVCKRVKADLLQMDSISYSFNKFGQHFFPDIFFRLKKSFPKLSFVCVDDVGAAATPVLCVADACVFYRSMCFFLARTDDVAKDRLQAMVSQSVRLHPLFSPVSECIIFYTTACTGLRCYMI